MTCPRKSRHGKTQTFNPRRVYLSLRNHLDKQQGFRKRNPNVLSFQIGLDSQLKTQTPKTIKKR